MLQGSFLLTMSERLTEDLFLKESKAQIGENPFGFIYEQGDVPNIASIKSCLQKTGGKPKDCALDDFSCGGTGKAKPEFIITFNEDHNLVIVVECKKSV